MNLSYLVGGNHIVLNSRGMLTGSIPSMAHHPGATERVPSLNSVSKPGEAEVSIFPEGFHNGNVGPSATVL